MLVVSRSSLCLCLGFGGKGDWEIEGERVDGNKGEGGT